MKVSYDSNRNTGGSNISCSIAIMALSPMAEIVNELDTTGRYRIIFCDIPSALRAELKLEILSKFCQEQRLLYSQGDRNGRHAYRTKRHFKLPIENDWCRVAFTPTYTWRSPPNGITSQSDLVIDLMLDGKANRQIAVIRDVADSAFRRMTKEEFPPTMDKIAQQIAEELSTLIGALPLTTTTTTGTDSKHSKDDTEKILNKGDDIITIGESLANAQDKHGILPTIVDTNLASQP